MRIPIAHLLLAFAGAAAAAPFTPASDAEVLERLPDASSPLARDLAAERRALAKAPADLARATALAWRYIAAGRSESDPRYLGLAEGVLAPWLQQSAPPGAVLMLRATLLQNRHEFAAAERDLAALLRREPRNAQAWLTLAVVARVRGDLPAAGRACGALLGLADSLTATTCLADVASLAGRAAASERALASALENAPNAPPGLRAWALTSLGEIQQRLGRTPEAEASYQASLALGRDGYTLAAYADLLLDAGRPRDVLRLLDGEERADGLLLRIALAELAAGGDSVPSARELRARFAGSAERGERLHLGEEARFALAFGDARDAVALARENFAVQREPRDLRVLLEAALAARDRVAAEPGLAFLAQTGLEDPRIRALAARVEALR